MTLGWSDGVSFIPINFALLASADDKKVLDPIQSFDKRSLTGRRRALAQTKGTDVMIKLLKTAINLGHMAKYVLFDSWFSLNAVTKSSTFITNIKQIFSKEKNA